MVTMTATLIAICVVILLVALWAMRNPAEHLGGFGSTREYRRPGRGRERYTAERIDCRLQPDLCTDRSAYYDDYAQLPPFYGN